MASKQQDSHSASVPHEELSKLRNALLAIGGDALPLSEHDLAKDRAMTSTHVTMRTTAMDDVQPGEASHFPDGDTQPMESQVYREYSKLGGEGYTCGTTRQSQQGEHTGDMNLLDAWPDDLPADETQEHAADNEDYADLLETQQTGDLIRFPQTPAIAGQKHARNGDLLTSGATAKRTPVSQLFGGNAQGMTATQMFAQTQEPSSPFHGDVVSDPVSSRPSPNVVHRFSTSSPQLGTPPQKQPILHKTFPEPRSDYRAIRLSPIPASQDDYDDSDDEIPRPRSSRSNPSIPKGLSNVGSRPRSGRSAHQIDLTKSTPATVRKGGHDFDVLDSPQEEEVVIINEEEDFIHDPNQDDDVYDEHSQAVIKSSGLDDEEAEVDEEPPVEHAEPGLKNSSLQEPAIPNSQVANSQPAENTTILPTQVTSTSLVLGTQCQDASSQPEIPVEATNHRVPSSPPLTRVQGRHEILEHNSTPLSTARSYMSSRKSPAKPAPDPSQLTSQQSMSPRKRAKVSRFGDIEAEKAIEDGSTKSQDMRMIDEVMGNVITEDDQQLFDILSATNSPARKKRRVTYTSARRAANKAKELPSKSSLEDENVLRESPSKANELPETSNVGEETQRSAKKRERAGADAVSQLVATRTKKSSKRKSTPKNARSIAAPALADNVAGDRATEQDCEIHVDVPVDEGQAPLGSREECESAVPLRNDEPTTEENGEADTLIDPIVAPERVLALYGLNYQKYYTATWLGRGDQRETYKIQFDDGRIADVKTHQVVSLDLRVGDVVKLEVEKGTAMYNKELVIRGFGPVVKTEAERAKGTDQRGRLLARVELKSGEGGVVNGMINHVKIDQNKFKHFLDRTFTPPPDAIRSRAETPASVQGLSTANTPGSRTRRGTNKWLSHFREGSTDSWRTRSESGIFDGMAFSFSGLDEAKTARLTGKIRVHGGVVLDKGLNELFDIPKIDFDEASSDLILKPDYEHLGFVALITDSHSRKAKYIEALALGMPALSSRFITDSLEQRAVLLSWSKYLLAAGESAYLEGAIRSRQLLEYSTSEARLSQTVSKRARLLGTTDGVLVVPPPKSSPYYRNRLDIALYLQSLRPGRVRQVSTLSEAAALLKKDPDLWNWVHVGGPASVAANALFETGSKKRKREQLEEAKPKVDPRKAQELCRTDYLATHGQVKVVNDEFVIQSLILGTLVG